MEVVLQGLSFHGPVLVPTPVSGTFVRVAVPIGKFGRIIEIRVYQPTGATDGFNVKAYSNYDAAPPGSVAAVDGHPTASDLVLYRVGPAAGWTAAGAAREIASGLETNLIGWPYINRDSKSVLLQAAAPDGLQPPTQNLYLEITPVTNFTSKTWEIVVIGSLVP
jgi:hypothetical protein